MLRRFANQLARNQFYFSTTRPFKILGVQQVAVGHQDKAALAHFWIDTLGIKKIGSYVAEEENVTEEILELGEGPGKVEIDIMTPIDPQKSPKVHKPNLNHLGLWVDDLKACIEYLQKEKGVKMAGGIRKGAAGYDVAFIHPKSACGVLVELAQAPQEVIKHFSG